MRTVPQKLIAAGLIARLEDVGEVDNDLIADPEVVRAVADALAEDVRTAPYVLQIDARHGIVGVRGEVPSQEVADAAIALAGRRAAGQQRAQPDDDRRRGLSTGRPAARGGGQPRAGPSRTCYKCARVTQTSPQPTERVTSRQRRIDEQRRKIDTARREQRRKRLLMGGAIVGAVAILIALVIMIMPRPVRPRAVRCRSKGTASTWRRERSSPTATARRRRRSLRSNLGATASSNVEVPTGTGCTTWSMAASSSCIDLTSAIRPARASCRTSTTAHRAASSSRAPAR